MATVDLVLPVYNEEAILERSTLAVLAWAAAHPEHEWRIVIADNASVDRTLEVARLLEPAAEDRFQTPADVAWALTPFAMDPIAKAALATGP